MTLTALAYGFMLTPGEQRKAANRAGLKVRQWRNRADEAASELHTGLMALGATDTAQGDMGREAGGGGLRYILRLNNGNTWEVGGVSLMASDVCTHFTDPADAARCGLNTDEQSFDSASAVSGKWNSSDPDPAHNVARVLEFARRIWG